MDTDPKAKGCIACRITGTLALSGSGVPCGSKIHEHPWSWTHIGRRGESHMVISHTMMFTRHNKVICF
ncbi:hypothetical protein FRC12_007337 [Ceratobasidium sp. 428]|nr:hypothetical protein FRC12_007337 [Ceratobasidium sp. 428]